ncbi:PREDICTED: uncharacterized protein LOC108712739 isoform X2 [Pelobates cultripes]|uniref:Interleukin-1 beta n=1 Tax=Pelobates cultripes TaxID=61616 RepID=A0AAD1RN62_PELCU|nr:PREDICTED: uncharacterized protein LOC108712739 isoform X2 [Pelobates cultripes]
MYIFFHFCVQMSSPYPMSFPCWYQTIEFNYPTTPYQSLRQQIPKILTILAKKRRYLNMIKKFDANDISYINYSNHHESLNPGFESLNPDRDIIKKETSIRDDINHYFIQANDILMAKVLQGSNEAKKAKFTIIVGKPKNQKTPVTLQIVDKKQYLTYESGKLILQVYQDSDIDYSNQNPPKYFFYMSETPDSKYTFEPVMAQNMVISTTKTDTSKVTVEPNSSNIHYNAFVLDTDLVLLINNGDGMEFLRRQQREESFGDYDQYFLNGSGTMSAQRNLRRGMRCWGTVHLKQMVCPTQWQQEQISYKGIQPATLW